MNDWFRSWHGAPTDPKWRVIAARAGVPHIVVPSIVWALFDHASQAEDRGSVAGFDFETYALDFGIEENTVRAVYTALEAKQLIVNGRIAKWERRQPKREDSSGGRTREWRKRAEDEPKLPLETERPAHDAQPPPKRDAAPEPVPTDAPEKDAPRATPTPPQVTISAQARALADEIAVAAGHTLEFVPPSWCGAALRVEMWLNQGWSPPLILDSVRAQIARKRDGPPGSITYFEKGIAAAHADRGPLPTLTVVERNSEVIHVRPRSRAGSGLAALEELGEQFDAASSAQGE